MLEILALVFVCRAIGSICRDKGRAPIGFQIMAVVLWFGFEFVGAVAAAVLAALASGTEEPSMLIVYAGALGGAVFSLLVSFGVVKSLPVKRTMETMPAEAPNPFAHAEQRPMF